MQAVRFDFFSQFFTMLGCAVSLKHVGTACGLLRQICADMPEVLRLDDNDESEVQGNTRNAV